MNKRIDELTKELFTRSTEAFSEIRKLEMLIINIKISTAKMGNNPEDRALAATGDIIEKALIELESSTKSVRDSAKEIGKLNKECD